MLGDPDNNNRSQSVENHYKWIEIAKTFGCHSIRVNAGSRGSYDEQIKLAADGLARLSNYAADHGLNVIVENHGGLSSNGAWLASVMRKVNLRNCGTLPDFGNFRISKDEVYDHYKGVEELMPYAFAVSAKSYDFNEHGNDTHTDYYKMMKIVIDSGYHGYVGIEYEGSEISEMEGIRKTLALLIKVREVLS
jgi:sugar phosphate isomerase/epimerase